MDPPPRATPALSEMSRVVLRNAGTAAAARGAAEVAPEHLLLALLAIPEAVGCRLLRGQGVAAADVARDLAAQLGPAATAPGPPPPLAPATEAALATAHAEAAAARAEYVGTEFLLLALATRSDRPEGRVLARQGLDAAALRAAITWLRS
jgi:ATP-dependent Clp protease ATP-binding subunit ClpA